MKSKSSKRKLTRKQVDDIYAQLCGSTGSLNKILADIAPGITEDDLTVDDCLEIDNLLLYCPNCGWWYDAGESVESKGGELVCDECGDEE